MRKRAVKLLAGFTWSVMMLTNSLGFMLVVEPHAAVYAAVAVQADSAEQIPLALSELYQDMESKGRLVHGPLEGQRDNASCNIGEPSSPFTTKPRTTSTNAHAPPTI